MSVSERLMRITHFKEKCFTHGVNSYLIDDRGELFLDFFADVGTSSLGYNSGAQRDVLRRLLDGNHPVHAPNLFGYNLRNEAAERLCKATGMDKAFFCNSGAEAVEAAIKLARLHANRLAGATRGTIYTYKDGFHGRTLATLAAGGPAPTYHRDGFGPFPEGFEHFTDPEEIMEDAIAVLLAPIYGNNDVRPYPLAFLQELREICDETGALLIFDEVQTGSGRTGAVTLAQKVGIEPDVLTLAKGIGMGAPVGVCLARAPYSETFTPGTHWSTFGGNPLSAAFVLGMLDWLETPGNLEHVNQMGDFMRETLAGFGWAKRIRGEGMLIAFDIDKDGLDFAAKCLENNLIIGAFRSGPGPVKITPPLNTPKLVIESGLGILDMSYRALQ